MKQWVPASGAAASSRWRQPRIDWISVKMPIAGDELGSLGFLRGGAVFAAAGGRCFATDRAPVADVDSDIAKQGHKSEVHMSLIVAVEESGPRIIRHEIHLPGRLRGHNHNILVQSCERL